MRKPLNGAFRGQSIALNGKGRGSRHIFDPVLQIRNEGAHGFDYLFCNLFFEGIIRGFVTIFDEPALRVIVGTQAREVDRAVSRRRLFRTFHGNAAC